MNLRASDEAVLNEFFKNTKYPSLKKEKNVYQRNLHPCGTSVRREDDERVRRRRQGCSSHHLYSIYTVQSDSVLLFKKRCVPNNSVIGTKILHDGE
jgi:hypothetical protein